MKAESNIMPQQPYTVDTRGAEADVTFFVNPIETERDGETVWEYDTYTLTIFARPDLTALIEENYAAWLASAMAYDSAPESHTPSMEEKVEEHDEKIVTMEEALVVIFGG